jgi:hypothetical protein
MLAFSEGLSKMVTSDWAPQPTAEAPDKLARIAETAAHSRLRPIADGPNQWDMHRSSAFSAGFPSPGLPLSVQSQVPAPGQWVRVLQVAILPKPVTLFLSAEVYGC